MTDIDWHESVESLLSELCDEAQIRCRLHNRHHHWYATRNKRYTLPVVVLSALSGSGNFLAGQFPVVEQHLIIGIGCISIFISIISAVSQFLKLAELSENHRIAGLAWNKFYTKLKLTLLLQRHDRSDCREFFSSVVSDYERLSEISPDLLDKFKNNLKKKLEKRDLGNFQLPFYLNGYKHISPIDVWEDNSLEIAGSHND